jgi:hypothetical protein
MNDEERNVLTIVTLGRIVEASLWYCLPPRDANGFSLEERKSRANALKALTSKGTPFDMNCHANGPSGKELQDEMGYFIDDVYGEPGRIVTVDLQNKVNVESSLIVELFTNIVKLRAYLEAFIKSACDFLKKDNKLEPEFEALVANDMLYYHSFAGKISCILISRKFVELNDTANTYAKAYSKDHGGINPKTDPEFNVRNDPSFRMVENEFHELNQDMVNALNTYNDNEDFKYARQQVYNDCEIFSGKKKTTDINAFFKIFDAYFDKIISATQQPLNNQFMKMGEEMNKYQAEMMAKQAELKKAEAEKAATSGDVKPETEKENK